MIVLGVFVGEFVSREGGDAVVRPFLSGGV